MANITNHSSGTTTKALLVADSGTGKTGSLISLVQAGYNLRIVDFDNGLDYLINLIREVCPERAANVSYVTCTDKFKAVNGQMLPAGQPKAFSHAMDILTHWKDGEEDFGKLETWTPNEVLVVDSMTFMGEAALRYVKSLNGHGAQQPSQPDWGQAMSRVEACLALLYSSTVPCNVIVTSHIVTIEDDSGSSLKAYPSALGRKLPPKVGRYFNSVLTIKRKGSGANERRVIKSTSEGILECKASAPGIPPELPIETGLADYFAAVQAGSKAKPKSEREPTPASGPGPESKK